MCQEKVGAEISFSQNLFFIGFMGCGKSTVSRKFCELYDMEQIEMDEKIEQQEGMRISEIFSRYGEERFRDMETDFLRKLQHRRGLAVSCGGGVPLRRENVELMRKNGRIIFLTAEPQTIYERVKNNGSRPLLEGKKNPEAIGEMIEQRRPAYEAAADIQVAVDGKSPEEIAKEIRQLLK